MTRRYALRATAQSAPRACGDPTSAARRLVWALLVSLSVTGPALAQPYPNRPVKLVIGFAPGGAADFVSHTISQPLGRALGQTVIVDNRVGSGSSIATESAMLQAGRLKALAVTGAQRSPLVPDMPGMVEAGLPADAIACCYGLLVPAVTLPAIIRKLFDALQDVTQRPKVKSALAREGTEVAWSRSPDDVSSFPVDGNRCWAKLVPDAGVKIDRWVCSTPRESPAVQGAATFYHAGRRYSSPDSLNRFRISACFAPSVATTTPTR